MLSVGFITFVCSLLFWLVIFVVEQRSSRLGVLPARTTTGLREQRFLYIQDFHTNSWGDIIGLTLVNVAVVTSLFTIGFPEKTFLVTYFVLAFISTVVYYKRAMSSSHIPDSGYPAIGQISFHGRLHLVYWFVEFFIVLLFIHIIVTGMLAVTSWLGLLGMVGIAIYAAATYFDIREGNLWYPGHREIAG